MHNLSKDRWPEKRFGIPVQVQLTQERPYGSYRLK